MVMVVQDRRNRPSGCLDAAEVFVRAARPRRVRTLRQFAEQEIWVKHGSQEHRFRCSSQPFSGVLFDELDSGHWYEAYITGPSQSSKSTCAHLIPAAHAICELRENIVLGIPLDEMVDDKIGGDLFGMLRRSPGLRGFLPTSGTGSKAGKIREKVVFAHGVEAKPMTRRSGDVGKAGYPARIVLATEAADWSQGATTSPEADPLRQLRARQLSFERRRRRLIVEGTCTTPDELPLRARGSEEDPTLRSSRTRLVTRCPHCPAWIAPEREHLQGWQGAASVDQAANEAYFVCPECGARISDDERRSVAETVVALHAGQVINQRGEVEGALPETHTLWFQWGPWHNQLLSIADIAVEEWTAAQIEEGTEDRDNAERSLCQFTWSRAFRSLLSDLEPLDSKTVRRRREEWPRNVLPPDTTKLTIGVDLGDWTGWWLAIAWRQGGQRYIPAYGNFDVKRSAEDNIQTRLLAALEEFRESVCQVGFAVEGADGLLLPDAVWIDGGYEPDSVAKFVRSSGPIIRNRYRLARGRGQSCSEVWGRGMYSHPKRQSVERPLVGRQWFAELNRARRCVEITFNADYWKLSVHEGLRAALGAPGAISLFRADSKGEHAKISNHFCNEQLHRSWQAEKGQVERWVRKGENHWLDCAAMASAAGDSVGFHLPERAAASDLPPSPAPAKPNWYAQILEGR